MIRFDSRVALRTRIFTPMLLLISSGCGNFTAGGVTGEARVTLLGDAPDPVPASLIAAPRQGLTWSSTPFPTDHDDPPEGEIGAEVDASLIINGVPVTGPIDVELTGPDLVIDWSVGVNPRERRSGRDPG